MVLFFLFSCVFLRISEFCLFKYQAFVSVCCQPVPPSELLSVHLIQLITLTLPSYSSVCLSDFLSLSLSLSHSSLAPSTYLYMLLYLSIYISGYIFIFFLICFSLSLPLFTFKVSSSLSLLFRTSLHQSWKINFSHPLPHTPSSKRKTEKIDNKEREREKIPSLAANPRHTACNPHH